MTSKNPRPAVIERGGALTAAVNTFRSGGVIAYPTETLYGLGVDPFNADAVKKLFSLKGRNEDKPVSVIIKDTAMLKKVAVEITPVAWILLRKFWPGPLTIIFKATAFVPHGLTADTGTIGVRISDNPLTQALLEKIDSPITATSANPSGAPPPKSVKEVLEYFDGKIDLIVDGGTLPQGASSTIVDATSNEVQIVREGVIPSSVILQYLKDAI